MHCCNYSWFWKVCSVFILLNFYQTNEERAEHCGAAGRQQHYAAAADAGVVHRRHHYRLDEWVFEGAKCEVQ